MADIKTAKEFMMQCAKEIKTGGVWSDEIIERIKLNPKSDYNYCPYCVQRAKRGDAQNWKQGLQPLWRIKHFLVIEIGDGKGRGLIDIRFFCDVCKKEITEDDYLQCRPVQKSLEIEYDLSKIPRGSPVLFN